MLDAGGEVEEDPLRPGPGGARGEGGEAVQVDHAAAAPGGQVLRAQGHRGAWGEEEEEGEEEKEEEAEEEAEEEEEEAVARNPPARQPSSTNLYEQEKVRRSHW